LARHDETYMPPEVADALKRSGHWNPAEGGRRRPRKLEPPRRGRGQKRRRMIPELGHFALALALALSWRRRGRLAGAQRGDARLMGAASRSPCGAAGTAAAFGCLMWSFAPTTPRWRTCAEQPLG
jgi:hypothetical protein